AATPAYAPLLRTGSALAQSDAVIGGPGFRAATGATGNGVKVGVLSDSVSKFGSGLAGSVASGDPPPNVQVLQEGAGGNADEGRAMLEIVHDIAPGASLAFHTANGGPQAFANGIIALANAGAKVIVDDIGYANSPMFNDGVIAKAADQVFAAGAVYASAA